MKKIQSSKWYMRITILFLFIIPLSVSAAQEKVSVKGKSITIKEAINIIEKNSVYSFFFKSTDLDNNRKKDINCAGTLDEVLSEVLKGSNIKYTIKGKDVILSVKEVKSTTPQQSKKNEIIGVVVDYLTGDPVIGATVQVKGASTGVISDIDGKFKVNASPEDILVISYIGYQTMERKVGKQKLINIELKEDSKALDEVVVTAFGVGQKKESLVGSVQQIKPAELKVPSSSLSSSFAGRLAGVISVQSSSEPGADGANFWIRGKSNLNGNSALIVLDGVEISSSDLNALDPEVIEGFSVLKDATATALYGTRGANGVMIVTTKRGEDLLKPIINIRVEGSARQLSNVPEYVDGIEYMKLYNEAKLTRGDQQGLYSDDKIAATANSIDPLRYPNVNWYKEMFNKLAFSERANVNIRGGKKSVHYFMSAAVKRDGGNLKSLSKDYFSYNNSISVIRYDFVNNLDIDVTKTTKVSMGLNASIRNWNGPTQSANDIFNLARTASPVDFPIVFPAQENDTHLRWGGMSGGTNNGGYKNPIAEYVKGYKSNDQSTFQANLRLEQDLSFITKGLKIKALASFKNLSTTIVERSSGYNQYQYAKDSDNLEMIGSEQVTNLTTKGAENSTGTRKLYIQAYLDYNRTFGSHDVNAMFLYNQDETSNNKPTSLLESLPQRKQGIAGRISYGYENKYLVEGNFGYNGSENFVKGHRFGFFPSIAVGYNISEEKFWKPLSKVISRLKLKASYGLVGNDYSSERFAYLETISLNGAPKYTFGTTMNKGAAGPVWTRYYNPDLQWEVGKKFNAGFDLTLFNDVNISLDVFKERREKIYLQRTNSIPTFIGIGSTKIYGNVGEVDNQGLDFTIDYNKQVNKDLFVSVKGTFTYAHNEIRAYDDPPYLSNPNLSRVGHSIDQALVYVAEGLFTQEEIDSPDMIEQTLGYTPRAGDIKYKDVNGDGIIDENDRVYTGNTTSPEIIYGFGSSIKYKKWDVSFLFQGAARRSLFMNSFHPFGTNAMRGVMDFVAEGRWTEENPNPNATYPRLSVIDNPNNTVPSTYWMRNGAFLKLKNAEIGYTHKFFRVYLSGSNLLTFSPFKYWDPEMGGGSGMSYPTARTFNIGFQLTFK
ncbi:TonB-dependent receptor [Bacteroides sp. GM023]|uniref:TonB-dependent receptor n=1 Tax=Bacteroides sp. GM023 TaxID=2723058 RepID=UPI00168AE40A|nr:TonB-dependent receptor [Bacteroides sp. GM023]MBD3591927.1 TonB-dependent receptor [Bacteroides sp. GM023]